VIQRTFAVVVVCAILIFVPIAHADNSEKSVHVTATDFQFEPKTWTVDSGQEISLTFINKGVQEHEWVILKQGTEVVLPFDDDDEHKVYWEIEAGPGATQEEKFSVPSEPGVYSIVCGKPRHIERGMKATLVVE